MDSRLYPSGRLDWGCGKISTNLSLQETSWGLVISPAALLGSPDRIIGLQDALRESSRIPAFTFLIKSFDLLPEQRCMLYTGSGVMYTRGMAFFGVMKKLHCIQINQDLSSCSVNYYASRMQYPSQVLPI